MENIKELNEDDTEALLRLNTKSGGWVTGVWLGFYWGAGRCLEEHPIVAALWGCARNAKLTASSSGSKRSEECG
jgi:hypothetical protein